MLPLSDHTVSETVIAYPERLLIYHAGTGRTVFIGCLKVTTIFIFVFFALVVAPSHFSNEEASSWVAVAGQSLEPFPTYHDIWI